MLKASLAASLPYHELNTRFHSVQEVLDTLHMPNFDLIFLSDQIKSLKQCSKINGAIHMKKATEFNISSINCIQLF